MFPKEGGARFFLTLPAWTHGLFATGNVTTGLQKKKLQQWRSASVLPILAGARLHAIERAPIGPPRQTP